MGGVRNGKMEPVKYRLQMVYDILQNYIHESAISGDRMECPIKIMQGVVVVLHWVREVSYIVTRAWKVFNSIACIYYEIVCVYSDRDNSLISAVLTYLAAVRGGPLITWFAYGPGSNNDYKHTVSLFSHVAYV